MSGLFSWSGSSMYPGERQALQFGFSKKHSEPSAFGHLMELLVN